MSWMMLVLAMHLHGDAVTQEVRLPPASSSPTAPPKVDVSRVIFMGDPQLPADILEHLPRDIQLRLVNANARRAAIFVHYLLLPPS